MKRGISNLILALPIVISLMLLHCNMPSDPTDPSKTRITAVFKNAESVVFGNSIVDTVGKPLSVGAALYLPANFDSISLVIKENDVVIADTMFKTFKDEYYYDTVWCTRTSSSEGIKNVTMTPFSPLNLQPLSINIPILPRSGAPVHISFIKNATSATGTMPVQTFNPRVTVKLPVNVFVNPQYRFSGWATTATGSVEYTDKGEITLGTEDLVLYAVWLDQNSIAPVVAHAPSQLIAGKADTLLFAVDNSSRPDPLTISLITDPPLDPAVFSIVPTGVDSIKIAISKSAGPTTATIGIVTSDGTKSDTSWYPITLISPEAALWSTTSVDQNAVEGSLLKLDLSQYLSAANGTDVSLSADIGTFDKTTWNYTPMWGCPAKIPATITARKGDVSLALIINLTVAVGDTTKPQLSLVDPSLDGKKVNSAQITVECKATDAGAGIDSVVFTCGAKMVSGTLQGENVYSGVITGLACSIPSQIIITAIDKSRKRNRATLTFTVTRDSTMLDGEPPVIVEVSGPENGARVKNAKDSLIFTVTDNSGVDSVWWTLNDTFIAAVSTSGGNKYTVTYTLSNYGKNSIKLYAKDKSGAGNKGSQTIALNYNTIVTTVTPSGPSDGAAGISLTPSFTWTGGTDADGDSVFYRVFYGTSATVLSQMSSILTGKTVILAAAEQLLPKTKYYWRVTAWSKAFPDTVQSEVISFTTLDPTAEDNTGPQIAQTTGPIDGERVTTATGTITVSVTDPNSVTSVTVKLNNGSAQTLTAGASNIYTYNYTLSTYGVNKVIFTALDGSANHNSSEKTISLNYNTQPTAIATTAPAANATGVSTSPTFKWSGGDDEDGDGVTFTVNYGASQTSLTSTATVTGKTAVPGSPLAYGKTYYWQVTGTSSSAAYSDKVQSSVGTFSTEGSLPTISAQPQPLSAEEGQSVTFSVTASGFGTLSYQWRVNGGPITGANGPSYTISSVTTSMNNTTYDCVVRNEVGEVPSNAATLAVTAIPNFKVLFITDGGTPKPDSQIVKRGGLVTKPLTDPAKSGYRFTGWYELNATSGFSFTQKTITANLSIYAGWKKVYTLTYHKNTDEGGAVPASPTVYDSGTTVTVAGNTGNLTKTGYQFLGWTTTPNGSGTAFTTISVTSDIHLYPKWEMDAPTISTLSNKTCPVNESVTFTITATGPNLSYTWYMNNSEVGSGTSYTTSKLNVNDVISPRTYKCVVTNLAGSANSSATLAVSTVSDIDGNVYHEVKIGEQTWMMENLKVTRYRNGTSIPNVTVGSEWAALSSPGYCWYNNDITNKINYGALYNWYTVNAGNLAPTGWHVPSNDEWDQLDAYCIANGYNWDNTTEADKIGKSLAATEGWLSTGTYQGNTGNDLSSNNRTGFTAFPNGCRSYSAGAFYGMSETAYWWSSTISMWNSENAINTQLEYYLEYFNNGLSHESKYGFGVRCVKD
jgi:uncharacterized protein (TIGR02145 family)/uncharacterized repeat protein (TIGR02543 family)